MKKGSMAVGKNVSLNLETLAIVQGYMNKTKLTFSATLNLIIKDWDEISIQLQKVKDQQTLKKNLEYLDELKQATPIMR